MSKMKWNYRCATYYFCGGNALMLGLRFERYANTGFRAHLTISVLAIMFTWTRRYV